MNSLFSLRYSVNTLQAFGVTEPKLEGECTGMVHHQTGLFIGAEKASSINTLFPSSVALPWQQHHTAQPPIAETESKHTQPDVTTVNTACYPGVIEFIEDVLC